MKAFAATVAISTLLVLALGPMQLQGLPGHLRTHDGSMAENQEMERAVIEALLAMAQQHKNTAAKEQYFPIYDLENQATDEKKSQTVQQQQLPWIQHHPPPYYQATDEKKSQTVQQQNKTALIQQIMSEMARNQQVLARNQRIQNRRLQSAESQRGPYENAIAQQSGVTIEYCGPAGDIIQNALRFGLGFIPGGDSAYGVYIACAEQPTYPCTTVTVAVPANSIKADIDVCDLSKLLLTIG